MRSFLFLFAFAVACVLCPMLAFAQEVIPAIPEPEPVGWFGWLTANFGAAMGALAFLVLFFDRLAKLTPTESDNKIVAIAYKLFAVLGVKVPDIK